MKVALKNIRPPIWRRLEVPTEFSMARLSDVILAAFGWSNSHLHEFEVGQRRIGMPDPDDWQPPVRLVDWPPADAALDPDLAGLLVRGPLEDEAAVDLAAVLEGGARTFTYAYDFGDDWTHEITLEDVYVAKPSLRYPRCSAGRRSAPPEDCGGALGYRHFLAVLADPDHKEYAELRAWRPFHDAAEFALAAADEAVRHPTPYWG